MDTYSVITVTMPRTRGSRMRPDYPIVGRTSGHSLTNALRIYAGHDLTRPNMAEAVVPDASVNESTRVTYDALIYRSRALRVS